MYVFSFSFSSFDCLISLHRARQCNLNVELLVFRLMVNVQLLPVLLLRSKHMIKFIADQRFNQNEPQKRTRRENLKGLRCRWCRSSVWPHTLHSKNQLSFVVHSMFQQKICGLPMQAHGGSIVDTTETHHKMLIEKKNEVVPFLEYFVKWMVL